MNKDLSFSKIALEVLNAFGGSLLDESPRDVEKWVKDKYPELKAREIAVAIQTAEQFEQNP